MQAIVHATTNRVLYTKRGEDGSRTIKVASKTTPGVSYTIDVENGRCSCPAWIYQRAGSDRRRNPCKHLKALGFTRIVELESQRRAKAKGTPVKVGQLQSR